MSGGHYDYLYSRIEDMYTGEMEYPLLEELLQDFCKILKSLEWYKSGDTCEETYQEDVDKFIDKWFKSDQIAYTKAKNDFIIKIKSFLDTIE